jgi:hypothetical protein
MTNPFLTDRRPIDWTSYSGRPDPVQGVGCIPGYQRMALLGDQWPDATADGVPAQADVVAVEHEDGQIATGLLHKTDPRQYPKDAGPQLGGLRLVIKEHRRRLLSRFSQRPSPLPFVWYRPVMLRPGSSMPAWQEAVKAQAATGVMEIVDALVVDCHCRDGEGFPVWKDLLDEQVFGLARLTKKPLVVLVGDQWVSGPRVNQSLEAGEADQRFRYARTHPGVLTVARYGGNDNGGPGGSWRRLPWGSHPAEVVINKALGVT